MNDLVVENLAFQAAVCFLIWVPFALGALVVEEWGAPLARRWRSYLAHPVRAIRVYRAAHAH
ncbi:MAG: hypothetical protein HYS27_06525 [Deltaproteobacteria bacterium]|nr:hypothetical protein [Deltaproteobacteria bacterium]